jgi:polysaccharide deacetylase family protein (PEP-CTERM system associated)
MFVASFDVEDWFHAENVRPSLPTTDWSLLEARVERNTHELLDVLAELELQATFFVLGWIARRYPALVRRIAADGHEVASHTDQHERLYRLTRDELLDDLNRARATLEDLTGERVLGIRAPSFSISDDVLDALAECGYWYDSSYYAVPAHDRYGRLETPIERNADVVEVRPGLLELPMSRLRAGPLSLPWAGGGYFRLIPYGLYRRGVARRLRSAAWFMFYLHPWELDAGEVPPTGMKPLPKFRAYVGRDRVPADLRRLLAEFGTTRIDRALRALGYAPPAPA